MIRFQKDDESLHSLFNTLHQNDSNFFIKEGVLFHYHTAKDMNVCEQIVVPKCLRNSVLSSAHDGLLAGHGGLKRTLSRVSSNFFWPGMYRDVKAYVKSCDSCQRTIAKGKVPNVPLEYMPRITEPFKRVAIDLAGPFHVSDAWNSYILSVVDVASRFAEAIPLPESSPATPHIK